MGGWGSGGQNRTHSTVEDYRRLDSFAFYNRLMGDKYIYCHDTVRYPSTINPAVVYHVQQRSAEIMAGNSYAELGFSRVKGIDGESVRLYWLCPHCGKRVRYLYDNKRNFMCRKCLGANYEIQQCGDLKKLRQQMYRIVKRDLEYSYWQLEHPDIYIENLLVVPKPRYMRYEKYSRLMEKFRKLQAEYKELEFKMLYPTKWMMVRSRKTSTSCTA